MENLSLKRPTAVKKPKLSGWGFVLLWLQYGNNMKTVKTITFPLVAILVLSSLSCSTDEISPLQQLEINLVVLNEDGEKSNTLTAGTDFFIGFELINHSMDTFFLSHNDSRLLFSHLYKHDDFLLVYRLSGNTGGQQFFPVGKPYDPSVELYFPDINLPGHSVVLPPKGHQYGFHFPWSNYADNRPLNPGTYHSSFEDTVIINGVKTVIDTSIDFSVNSP